MFTIETDEESSETYSICVSKDAHAIILKGFFVQSDRLSYIQ